jgi:DNA-binding LacI/PurR family transcriptional regulator
MVPLRAGIDAPVVMRFAVSAVTAARAHDHDVLLLTQEEGEEGLRRVADSALVDALIVMDVQLHDPRLPLLRSLDRPSVLIGFPADPSDLTCIDLDFRTAGELCVERLAGLGHRAVALIGSPPDVYVRQTSFAQRVVQGFTSAAVRHGMSSTVNPCEATPAAAGRWRSASCVSNRPSRAWSSTTRRSWAPSSTPSSTSACASRTTSPRTSASRSPPSPSRRRTWTSGRSPC